MNSMLQNFLDNNKQLEINQEIVFSTIHINPTTIPFLEKNIQNSEDMLIDKTRYGYRIYINPISKTGYEDIDTIVAIARKKQCNQILLDADGLIYKSLKIYKWD